MLRVVFLGGGGGEEVNFTKVVLTKFSSYLEVV